MNEVFAVLLCGMLSGTLVSQAIFAIDDNGANKIRNFIFGVIALGLGIVLATEVEIYEYVEPIKIYDRKPPQSLATQVPMMTNFALPIAPCRLQREVPGRNADFVQ